MNFQLPKPAAVIVCGLLLFSSNLSAQQDQSLSLTDLFVDSSVPDVITLEAFSSDPDRATALLKELPLLLDKAQESFVLRQTEVLAAWFPANSPEYAETLYLRAAAFRQQDEDDAFRRVAAEFLSNAATDKHPRRKWMLQRFADSHEAADELDVAVMAWQRILDEKWELSPEDRLHGAGLMLRVRKARESRTLLSSLADSQLTQAQQQRLNWLLLDSLLVVDDRDYEVPTISEEAREANAFNLRRAQLLALRGDRKEALSLAKSLNQVGNSLTEKERQAAEKLVHQLEAPLFVPEPTPVPKQQTIPPRGRPALRR